MNRKEGFVYQFRRYVRVALPCGVLAGLALSCMDLLLFCKTIAKYFFGLDTIFALEIHLIGIYSAIFALLAVITGSSLRIYDWFSKKKRSQTQVFVDTLFVLYIISAVLILFISFHHCNWRSESFSRFFPQIRFLLVIPLLCYCFLRRRINTFCERHGLFSIFSFCSLFTISTIALLNCLLLFKITYPERLAISSFILFGIYFSILLLVVFRFFSRGKKSYFLPVLAVSLMYCTPLAYTFSGSKGQDVKRIANAKNGERPNVLLIVCDALRADALSIYGGHNSTPHIDVLAKEGIHFKKAFAQAPWTHPSMASLFTSLYPSVLCQGEFFPIDEGYTTSAEVFSDMGYFCKALVGNCLLSKECGFEQGFHEYFILNNLSPGTQFLYAFPIFGEMEYEFRKMLGLRHFIDTTGILTKEAIEFFKDPKKSSWFLWIHYMDPHDPYYPPREYLKLDKKKSRELSFNPYCIAPTSPRFGGPLIHELAGQLKLTRKEKEHIKMLYAAEVRYLDDMVGKLIEEMKRFNIYDKTIIVLTSDHGEEFWDHGSYYHGQSLYDELLRVPLILRGPGIPAGEIISDNVSLIDLMPTLRKMVELGNATGLGNKAAPLQFDEFMDNGYVFSEKPRINDKSKIAIRDSEFKLIYSLNSEKKELYNIFHDPLEKNDISELNNGIGESMVKQINEWKHENERLKNGFECKTSTDGSSRQDALRRLKALGYIQ